MLLEGDKLCTGLAAKSDDDFFAPINRVNQFPGITAGLLLLLS